MQHSGGGAYPWSLHAVSKWLSDVSSFVPCDSPYRLFLCRGNWGCMHVGRLGANDLTLRFNNYMWQRGCIKWRVFRFHYFTCLFVFVTACWQMASAADKLSSQKKRDCTWKNPQVKRLLTRVAHVLTSAGIISGTFQTHLAPFVCLYLSILAGSLARFFRPLFWRLFCRQKPFSEFVVLTVDTVEGSLTLKIPPFLIKCFNPEIAQK